ncbi:MAG TPA: Hsp33 family molecular chaperone HslO [Gammaproteobacteria bacterium]|nr:Hsp33 family molecular chaperone HslO [Gammaproteobacteria bacterium]
MNEVQGFILEDCGIRGSLVRLQETWQQVTAQHDYAPALKNLLGESLAATVLLANTLKARPRVSLQLQGDGPLKLLLIQCSEELRVRGLAQCSPPAARGTPLLGDGRLAVNVDTRGPNGFFQGIVPLVSTRLDACLEAYFQRSEQLPTRLILKGSERRIGGLLLQALPGHDPDIQTFADTAELAEAVSTAELTDDAAEALLPRLFSRNLIRLLEPRPVLHDCRCTPAHMAGILRMLGEDELNSLLDDPGWVELTCEFCNRAFRYEGPQVLAVLQGETPGLLLH